MDGPDHDLERALLQRAAAGDDRAFTTLVERHSNAVLRLATVRLDDSADGAEVAQDAFVRLYRALPRLRGESTLRTWLVRVTINLCVDVERRRHRDRRLVALDTIDNVATVPGSDGGAENDDAILREAIQSLPEIHREIVLLRYEAELSYTEISELLGIPSGTVGTRLAAALRTLRTHITSHTPKP